MNEQLPKIAFTPGEPAGMDHGTAFELAGSGGVDTGSARAALDLAITLAEIKLNGQSHLR